MLWLYGIGPGCQSVALATAYSLVCPLHSPSAPAYLGFLVVQCYVSSMNIGDTELGTW